MALDASAMSGAKGAFITVRGLVAGYGSKIAVDGVSFEVASGEHLSLLGPSGCGKSTTLRCIAGLETPFEGEITIGNAVAFSSARRINLPPEKRKLAMVFQSYAIWPHMSVFENVAYGLRARRAPSAEVMRRVNAALDMVGMREFAGRPATDLSGGQQQRVALARSYAVEPQAILLDEPLSNLDARLRTRMRDELKELQGRTDLCTIYVTHDQEEAMAMSNRIIVMREGKVEQIGAPLDIYDRPRSRFVADFIGAANVFEAEIAEVLPGGGARMRIEGGEIVSRVAPAVGLRVGERRPVVVRTVYPQLLLSAPAEAENVWPARVERRSLLGDLVAYTIRWPGGQLRVNEFPHRLLEENQDVWLRIPADRAIVVES